MNDEKWVSMKDICKHLGCSRETVMKLIKNQQLPGYKFGGKIWKFQNSEVDKWVRENGNQAIEENGEG